LVPKLSAASQERFLAFAEFLAQQGAAQLLGTLHDVAAAQLAQVPLSESLGAPQVQQLLRSVAEAFSDRVQGSLSGRGWAAFLLPSPAELQHALAPHAPDDRAVLLGADALLVDGHVVEQLAEEAEAVAASAEFADALRVRLRGL
jgi:hypothetical protein